MSANQIKNALHPKYLNQNISEENKRYFKKRIENTSAYELLLNSHGADLRRRYGQGFFSRLEREMFAKAINELRNDKWFINKVKSELKEEVEKEIRIEIMQEYNIDIPVMRVVD